MTKRISFNENLRKKGNNQIPKYHLLRKRLFEKVISFHKTYLLQNKSFPQQYFNILKYKVPYYNPKQLVDFLLFGPMSKNYLKPLLFSRDFNGNTLLHFAAKLNYRYFVEKIISLFYMEEMLEIRRIHKVRQYVSLKNYDNLNALQLAVKNGNIGIFCVLSPAIGKTPGYIQEMAEEEETVSTAMRAIVSYSCQCRLSEVNGRNLFHIAAQRGSVEILKIILPFFDIHSLDRSKNTALHYAVEANKVEAARFLLLNGANQYLKNRVGGVGSRFPKEKSSIGKSSRELAIKNGNPEMLELFGICNTPGSCTDDSMIDEESMIEDEESFDDEQEFPGEEEDPEPTVTYLFDDNMIIDNEPETHVPPFSDEAFRENHQY
jgi:hypothetical protein